MQVKVIPQFTAVLLAAGQSRRMGESKLLLPYGESTILETSLAHLTAAGIPEIIVVLNPESVEVQERCLNLAAAATPNCRILPVINPQPEQGMLSSAQAAVRGMAPGNDFLIALADQPAIPPALIRRLIEIFQVERPAVLRPTHGGKSGHPVLFSRTLREQLLQLGPEATLRSLVHAHPILPVPVETDAIHRDIDDPAAYQAELQRLRLDLKCEM